MKKKLALLMAVIMVVTMMPMNLMGNARPGQIRDPRNSPQSNVGGLTGWPNIIDPYTFRIDAAAFSQLALDGGSMSVIDFVLAGGANAGEVGFAAPWTITSREALLIGDPAGAAVRAFAAGQGGGNTFGFPTANMFHFHAGPNFRVDGETTDNAAFFNILNNIANARGTVDGNANRFLNVNWLEYDRPGGAGWGNRPSVPRVGHGEHPVYISAAVAAETGLPAGNNTAIHLTNDHPLPHTTFYRNVQVDLFPTDDTWAAMPGASPRTVNVHGVSTQVYDIPTLEGWIDVTIRGIRASRDDSEISIFLREGGGGVSPREVTLLGGATMFTGWGTGVNISAASVVPLDGIGTLSGIRIQEGSIGRLLDPDPANGGSNFNVRLVAPRNFVWDLSELELARDLVDDLEDLIRGARATGNEAFGNQDTAARFNAHADGDDAVTIVDPGHWLNGAPTGTANPITWALPTTNPFNNALTGRHEIVLNVQTPPRGTTFTARNTPAEITIRGISLIPVRGAATTGDLAIDVYVGDVEGGQRIDPHGHGTASILPRDPAQTRAWPSGSVWTERTAEASGWRARSLTVATLDWDDVLAIRGPGEVNDIRSGRWTVPLMEHVPLMDNQGGLDFADNDRWMHAGNHTIRIEEIIQGTLYSGVDRFELVPPEGVRIVDARVRGGRDGANTDTFGWGTFDRPLFFIPGLHQYQEDDGSMTFATRRLAPESQSRLRRMDIGLMLSVEAGFEHRHGNEIEIRVYRNGNFSGAAVVANVYDPIVVTQEPAEVITRNNFDVLSLTRVAGFTITEHDAGTLNHGDEIRFRLQAVQNGREITIPHGEMHVYLSEPIINEEDSGFELRELPRLRAQSNAWGSTGHYGVLGFEVTRTSANAPGIIEFDEVFVAGPTAPGLEWHVVIYGPQISPNSDLILGGTDYVAGTDIRSLAPVLRGSAAQLLSDYVLRGRFYNMPYDAVVLEVRGLQVIDADHPAGNIGVGPGGVFARRSFSTGTMVYVEGAGLIPELALLPMVTGYVTAMMNPRVFAEFIGVSVDWDYDARRATFTGAHADGTSRTVVLYLDRPTASVNGQQMDIAVGAGHPQHYGRIIPTVVDSRMFVPVRFLANQFGVPLQWADPNVILG